jgi:hypothetical protein
MSSEHGADSATPVGIELPSPTIWPVLLALGLALAAAGLVSTRIMSAGGLILGVASCFGWFLQVLPHEKHLRVRVTSEPVAIAVSPRKVARLALPEAHHRARLPLEIYLISAGIKGGLAGSIAMAVAAMLYGLISHGSVWYPINLLGAVVYAQTRVSTAQISAFHIELLLVATTLHLTTSILVGLLYGAVLPMLPGRPIVWGGLFAPLVWTGLLHSVLDIIDPLLNQRISWPWFLVSQVAFGVVAGLVVVRQARVPTWQYPLAARAGVETPGIMRETGGPNSAS